MYFGHDPSPVPDRGVSDEFEQTELMRMAFLQQPDRQPFLRVPAATAALVAALILAHVVRIMVPGEMSDLIIGNYAFTPERYSPAFLAAHNAAPQSLWDLAVPFVSYIFLHANFTHLMINCIWLLPFGAMAARRLGVVGFYLLFFLCGIAGAVSHLIAYWGSPIPIVGASAAIAGTMGAAFRVIATDGLNVDTMRLAALGRAPSTPLAPLLSRRMLTWSLMIIALFVLAGRYGIGGGPQPTGPVAWQAHIGGYLAGLLLAPPLDALHRWLSPDVAAWADDRSGLKRQQGILDDDE